MCVCAKLIEVSISVQRREGSKRARQRERVLRGTSDETKDGERREQKVGKDASR